MWDACFYGALLRMAQAATQAAPLLLTGLLLAGMLRCLLGAADTRRLFAADTWRALPQAWLWGMLLPVCSFGVIPICREMRHARISGGTILAFALSAPLFNPMSLLYGLTISAPIVILAFAACSLLVVTLLGMAWDHLCPGSAASDEPDMKSSAGLKRLLGVGLYVARESSGPTLAYTAVGLLGVGALSLALPPASMQHAVQHDDPIAPLVMAAVAMPAYASPMVAINQIASMFQHGNSVGAAFTLLVLGAGMNLGLAAWMMHAFGVRRTGLWFAMLIVVTAVISYSVERPLYPEGIEAADHTHAFDGYCRPYHATTPNVAKQTWITLRQETPIYEKGALAALGLLIAGGTMLRFVDPRHTLEARLAAPTTDSAPTAWYERPAPLSVIGLCGFAAVLAFSVVGCYAYYPRAREAFKEISIAHAEGIGAAITGDQTTAEKWLPIYEDWVRKLQVGIYLRGGRLSEFHRLKADLMLERLEELEHALAHDDQDELRRLCILIERTRVRLITAVEASFPSHCER